MTKMAKQVQKTNAKTAPKPAPKPAPKAAQTPKSNVPAKVQSQQPAEKYDDEMLREMRGDSGRGISTAAADNIVPLIYIVQSQSPVALRQKPEYIEGAQAGMFWFRGTKEVVDGDEGIPAVLCHMSTVWIEWRVERGSGSFVARHAERPDIATWTPDPKDPKVGKWMMPSGDTYVSETKEMVVVLPDTGDAYVLPCSGSNISAARAWNTACGRKRVPGSEVKAPLWGYVWRLKTTAKSNDKGDWYGLLVEEETNEDGNQKTTWKLDGGATYKFARQLNEDFETGAKRADDIDDVDGNADDTEEEQESETL